MPIHIYTDGASTPQKKDSGIPTPGGWAFVVTDDPKSTNVLHEENGFANGTTNNRMELSAVINALEYAYITYTQAKKLIIYTDSKYVSDSIYTGCLENWRHNNWVKSDGEPTKNADLWELMWKILKRYKFRKIDVDILWVRGHNGNYFNERCDKLAVEAKHSKIVNKTYE